MDIDRLGESKQSLKTQSAYLKMDTTEPFIMLFQQTSKVTSTGATHGIRLVWFARYQNF